MPPIETHLQWLADRQAEMVERLCSWAAINSGSRNRRGLDRMAAALSDAFGALGGRIERIEVAPREYVDATGTRAREPLGAALAIRKRPDAPRSVLLNIHMDTVYGPDHPFQEACRLDEVTLRGPGVADAKGGLVVMLYALHALERSGMADRLGWEVLINADEELGSPGSGPLLRKAAQRHHLGLIFEPALPDGNLIGARKGSGNFTVVVHGRSAHAGRDFEAGRNALSAAAALLLEIERLMRGPGAAGLTVNVARIDGGGPLNVVPDLGVGRFNVRVADAAQQQRVEQRLEQLVAGLDGREGMRAWIHGGFYAPPKPLNRSTLALLEAIVACGRRLGLELSWQPSGGVCDGNRFAAAGLPTVDTLGVVGGHLHSPEEYVHLPSLGERARLTALLLMELATGRLPWLGRG